jgi:chitin synthase
MDKKIRINFAGFFLLKYLIKIMHLLSVQKYIILSALFGVNILLAFTFGFHPDYWYAFMFALALGTALQSLSVIMILWSWICASKTPERTEPKIILFNVPCYNESMEELKGTLDSLTSQFTHLSDDIGIIIVCDGRVKGKDVSGLSTDQILLTLLNINDETDSGATSSFATYKNARGNRVNADIYECYYNTVKCMLIVKHTNQGKRDSITLVRRLAYGESDQLPESLMTKFCNWIGSLPDYIVGVDADTVLHPMCTEELIKVMEAGGEMCKGCVGFVDIPRKWSPFVMYQYAEYHFGQLVRRRAQSEITQKVNCLSGCNQIIRVCKETCGDELMNRYSRVPTALDTIFTHIRSYASEDRNHVCLMLSMYPYVTTVQARDAIAYTKVPETVPVFLSQRRRWTLGALTNDMLLTYLPGITLFERIGALINIITFSFNPFIFVATCFFIYAIVHAPTMLMLYLSIPMIIPFAYCLLTVPITRGFYLHEIIYFYLSYVVFLLLGLPVSTIVFINSLLGMDTIKWGKTRQITAPDVPKITQFPHAFKFTEPQTFNFEDTDADSASKQTEMATDPEYLSIDEVHAIYKYKHEALV